MGGRAGQAEVDQRALITFRLADGLGSDAGGEQAMETGGSLFGLAAQVVAEGDVEPPAGLAIEESAGGHGRAEHLFEAQALSAALGPVRRVGPGPAGVG